MNVWINAPSVAADKLGLAASRTYPALEMATLASMFTVHPFQVVKDRLSANQGGKLLSIHR